MFYDTGFRCGKWGLQAFPFRGTDLAFTSNVKIMGGIKGLMGLLFLMNNEKDTPIQSAIAGKRKLPKEKREILKDLKEPKSPYATKAKPPPFPPLSRN
jgi:hypothetical protein